MLRNQYLWKHFGMKWIQLVMKVNILLFNKSGVIMQVTKRYSIATPNPQSTGPRLGVFWCVFRLSFIAFV